MFTGTGDLYWYVPGGFRDQSLKDATADHTIAYSTSGSTSNSVVLAFISDLGLRQSPLRPAVRPRRLQQ